MVDFEKIAVESYGWTIGPGMNRTLNRIALNMLPEEIRKEDNLPDQRWSGWSVWLKSRMCEFGYLSCGYQEEIGIRLWVLLHVFPIYRAPVHLPGDGTGFVFSSSIARSDIVTGHRVPRPIDRVAARVAPGAPEFLTQPKRK
jgi:hypothetical protein